MDKSVSYFPCRFWLVTLVSGFCLLSTVTESKSAPKIIVEQPLYDFGAITNASDLLHDYVIRNAGNSDLIVTQVISSCTVCLKANIAEKKIPPGETSLLHTRLDLRLLNGAISRSVAIESNDPYNPWLTVGLTGVVVPSYQMTPMEINLDLSQGPQKASAKITPLLTLHAPLSAVDCNNSNILAKVFPTGFGRFVLTLEALDSLPRGNIPVQLTLKSTNSNDPPFHTTGFIHNPPDLEIQPERLQFLPQAEPQMRILWLKQHGANPLILLDIIPPSANFKCEIESDSTGYNYRIYVNAVQLATMVGQTNVLLLKMREANRTEHVVPVPVSVEPAGLENE